MNQKPKVAIIAATHFLGRGLVEKLYPQYELRVLGRSFSRLNEAFPQNIEKKEIDLLQLESIRTTLEGCQIIVNIAHASFTNNILRSLPSTAEKVVCIGSTWKYTQYPNERAEQVRQAEESLKRSSVKWVMLHPSMIYGMPEEKTVSRLINWINRFPVVALPWRGRNLVQPVHAKDIIDVLFLAVSSDKMNNQSFILAAHEPITYYKMIKLCAAKINKRVWVLPVPRIILKIFAKILSFTPYHSKLRSDQVDRLTEDKNFDVVPIEKVLGRNLLSFSEGLSQTAIGEL